MTQHRSSAHSYSSDGKVLISFFEATETVGGWILQNPLCSSALYFANFASLTEPRN